MFKVEKVMRIGKTVILLLCFCMFGLTACGEVVRQEGDNGKAATDEIASTVSSLSIEKNGSISSTIVESFGESYYKEDGLKSMIESAIEEYASANGDAEIKLKNIKVKDSMVNVLMEYGDYQAYAGFNDENFFAGTVRDANMAGFDLNVTLKSVSDSTEISKADLLGMGDSHIVIASVEGADPTVTDQIRINCFDEILYVSDGVTTAGKKSAYVELTNGYRVIVFK